MAFWSEMSSVSLEIKIRMRNRMVQSECTVPFHIFLYRYGYRDEKEVYVSIDRSRLFYEAIKWGPGVKK